ncbi:MAG TPA: lamin tail domain-containing protein [Verrucomicrobiae bacterium]|nr:lamin tail domain-containing protein [Verrucomicrobiae bacterium]
MINELMYHPVEEPTFDADGHPLLDLSEDVHEFVELYNSGAQPVAIGGWRLDGGIHYTFPNGVSMAAGGYLVIAKDPARLAAIPQYSLSLPSLQGPYDGQLSNNGETVQLKNGSGQIVEAVSYSEQFPWPASADALGASQRWTGIDPLTAQYRGRSLERVSASHPAQDPANWVASPWPGEPSPGRPNALQRTVPFPIVVETRLVQVHGGQSIITSNQPASLTVRFSATNELGAVRLEYFVDELNRTDEPTTNVAMTGSGPEFTAPLPALAGRSVVRYRVWAQRLPGDGPAFEQVVMPRDDDPYRWRSYFVNPSRTSTNDIYDILISSNSLYRLAVNLNDNPLNGPYTNVAVGTPPNGRWNLTEPAILVNQGTVYDVQIRHAGSFWRRSPGRKSFKLEFPAYGRLKEYRTLMILDKDGVNMFGHRVYEEAGFPSAHTRWVDMYMNNEPKVIHLEIEEHDQQLLDRYVKERHQLASDQPVEQTGHIYKASATGADNGPYGNVGPYGTNQGWLPLERYAWNYSSKNMDWEGYLPLKIACEELAAARAAGLAALRAHLSAKWDVDRMLTYLAIRNWMAETDDGPHNFFLWHTGEGKWTMLGWDFDNTMSQYALTIYSAANMFKDSVLTAFHDEYNQRIYWLAYTLLDPDNLATLGITFPFLNEFSTARRTNLLAQTGLPTFQRPTRPSSIGPAGGESIFPPASLQASPYAHTASPASPHAATIWKIRSAEGSFRLPVYAVTSSVYLTSIPVPFGLLEPGKLYYWTCHYVDAEGHPSVSADQNAFRYGGNYQRRDLLTLNDTGAWNYNDQGTNLGTAWRTPAYDDSAWATGPALLGVSAATLAAPVRTPLTLGRPTYYFRRKFSFSGDASHATLRLQHVVDDGAVFYLNGVEIYRYNLPTLFPPGGMPYSILAGADIGDPALSRPVSLVPTNLITGENLLAVEVHQKATNSADVVFGLALDVTTELDSGAIRLNEIMAFNRSTLANGPAYPDWLELYNPSDQPQSLNGLSLTDDPLTPLKFAFPAGLQLGAHDFLVVWCDAEISQPGLHTGFNLKSEGESIWLFNSTVSGLAQVDQVSYGLQLADYSIGRVPDGRGDWTLNRPTPNTANQTQELGSTRAVRINEWMAGPASGADWFELFNPDLRPVSIGGYYLTDDFAAPTNSPIPLLSYLGGYTFTKFVADDDAAAGADHVRFKLSASGEMLGLYDPDRVPIDQITFGTQTSGLSQGRLPDGSATIVSLFSGASPGRSNAGDADGDGLPNDWEQHYLLNPLLAEDAQFDSDGDGMTNLEEFLAGTDPTDSADRLRVTAIDWVDGSVRLRFPLVPGKVYEIQYCDETPAGTWQSLRIIGPETSARTAEVLDTNVAGVGARYYRIVLRRI